MVFAWTPELSIGVGEIDAEHKELIDKVNIFFDSLKKAGGGKEMESLFTFLEGYMTAHFSREENYLKEFALNNQAQKYQTLIASEHAAFIRDFLAYKEDMGPEGPSFQMLTEFQKWIHNWLTNHFQKVDVGLAAFVRKAGAASTT